MNKSFCFILTPVDVDGALPLEVIENHWIQKADTNQIVFIREKVSEFSAVGRVPQYEFNLVGEKTQNNRHWTAVPLQEQDWRYLVINFFEENSKIHDLAIAAGLLKIDLEFGFTFTYHPQIEGPLVSFRIGFITNFFQSFWPMQVEKIKTGELKQIGEYYLMIQSIKNSFPNVYQLLNQYDQLKALPKGADMLVLGYFSIIEALVAHKPKLAESLDSINHQIKSKMILLSKKFKRPLNYPTYFDECSEEKIWRHLYGYRSAMAHNPLIDFQSEFKILKDKTVVRTFLDEVVKLTLIFAMQEPEFLADLKNC
jgi:hypothetical protein